MKRKEIEKKYRWILPTKRKKIKTMHHQLNPRKKNRDMARKGEGKYIAIKGMKNSYNLYGTLIHTRIIKK